MRPKRLQNVFGLNVGHLQGFLTNKEHWRVVKATLYSPTSNKEVELCLPEAVGKDLAVVTFKCSEFTSGTYALRIYPDQTGTTSFSGNVIVFEKTLDLTTSVAFSANTNEDADSGILCKLCSTKCMKR
nr:unnamed protein product [Haemonchus contortus]